MSRPSEPTHYDTLGVSFTADSAEIRRVYRQLVRRHHPDLTAGRPEPERRRAEARIRELNRAWAVLGDAAARRDYDRELRSLEPLREPVGEGPRPGQTPESAAGDPGTHGSPPLSDTVRRGSDSGPGDVAPALSPAFVRVLLWGPVVLIVALGVALLVFTAYAGHEGAGSETAASCVLRGEGREAVRVDCDEPNDGTVAAEVVDSSQCAPGTTPLIITEPVFDGWVCVELLPTDAQVPATG
ncbi:MAG: Chaperone protein DnaJ [Acidimicrobiales bacterium]|nr:Chaperone protein DnaJ [Acidimicrobiales bacterium]